MQPFTQDLRLMVVGIGGEGIRQKLRSPKAAVDKGFGLCPADQLICL
jgi:hypothetical protein